MMFVKHYLCEPFVVRFLVAQSMSNSATSHRRHELRTKKHGVRVSKDNGSVVQRVIFSLSYAEDVSMISSSVCSGIYSG